MIHKVYIVRCSYCHSSLREPGTLDYRPRYFHELGSILYALVEAGWKTINGTELCPKCADTHIRTEL